MKLKQAKKEAKRQGCKYIAVDKNRQVWGYLLKPKRYHTLWMLKGHEVSMHLIGLYDGNKNWKHTLREIHD